MKIDIRTGSNLHGTVSASLAVISRDHFRNMAPAWWIQNPHLPFSEAHSLYLMSCHDPNVMFLWTNISFRTLKVSFMPIGAGFRVRWLDSNGGEIAVPNGRKCAKIVQTDLVSGPFVAKWAIRILIGWYISCLEMFCNILELIFRDAAEIFFCANLVSAHFAHFTKYVFY